MARKQTRQTKMAVEDSWRMVEEGENDSFDTSIVQGPYEDDLIPSSGPSQLSSSQGYNTASQDSIHDFVNNADDDQVILRAPFHPSLVSTRHASVDKELTPVPEFFMPRVEVNSPPRSNRSSRKTIRPEMDESHVVRRRGFRQQANNPSPQKHQCRNGGRTGSDDLDGSARRHEPTLGERFSGSVPTFLFDIAAWCISVVGMALRYAKWPIAIMLAIYMTIGAGMIAKNMITESISASMSPLCRIPGASFLDLPFCPDMPAMPGAKNGTHPVEFDELMSVQAQFEKVLEDSAQGVSLPMEMKRAEASVRDLRTLVKFSDLPAREELVYEFDGYIDTVRTIATDLQRFNTHVGSVVDSVIAINRFTTRYIDSIALTREANDNVVSRWSNWIFSPFQPAVFDERMLLDMYVENTAQVSDKIGSLILEAQAALRLLDLAENHLQAINENVVRSGKVVKDEQHEVFWTLWTLVGANARRLHNLKAQLGLLRQVDKQRSTAVMQLVGLDRVSAPELLVDQANIPLSVHVETINAGIERLEGARMRIKAEENERIQQALKRARPDDDRLIDG
ncbi:uncharacterized protein BCR38DRAFT_449934 [Pseudomassariella vexata]|uniref:Uncharacterized protein n=1 Tax=Pseudomassariella vexata TaxID=1141098 RepID=A0A1Y2DDM1_9PEZI|nr:uncharacterized protein BCR38DRAFT_449934 [Pseudomassariella vexata]ORY57216.1 hypothetical protein BCR38DRAFT_449934 [Pseudomassariella vexata]